MSPSRIVGLVLLAVGVILLVFGVNATGAFGERLSETFTGHYTNTTMWYIIGGIGLIIGGGAMSMFGGGRPLIH